MGGGYYLSFKNISGAQGYVLKPSAAKNLYQKRNLFIYLLMIIWINFINIKF